MADQLGTPLPLTRRQRDAKARAELHPVAWQVREIAAHFGEVEAPARFWLRELNRRADESARQSHIWPANSAQLGRCFAELREGLELLGVELSFRRSNGERIWCAETVQPAEARRHWEATKPEREAAIKAREKERRAELAALLAALRARNGKVRRH